MMRYEYLEQDYIDDVIAGALHAREVEHFHYALDLANFQDVLAASNDPELRADMQSRIDAITRSLDVVDKIYAALLARIVDPARHALAVARCAQKRAQEAERTPAEKQIKKT